MALKPFAIQGADLTLGGVNLQAGSTGVVIPGVTQATNYTVDEVEDNGDQTHSFTTVPTVIDPLQFAILNGDDVGAGTNTPAEYEVEELDDDGYIDGIDVTSPGSFVNRIWVDDPGYMYATEVADAIANFNAGDWVQIPFQPKVRAGEIENIGGGGADLGDFSINGSELSADSMTIKTVDGELTIESDTHVYVNSAGGSKIWSFANDGNLTLPENGDILNSNGSSVLGGGAGAGFSLPPNTTFDDFYDNGGATLYNNSGTLNLYSNVSDNLDGVEIRVKGTGGDSSWNFKSSGAITFPDGSIQTTAYTGASSSGGSNFGTPRTVWFDELTNPNSDYFVTATSSQYDSQGNIISTVVSIPRNSGNRTITVVKHSSLGQVLWQQEYAGTGYNIDGWGVAVDSNDDVYISGSTDDGGGNTNLWILKADGATGDGIWAKTLTGAFSSVGSVVEVGADDHPVVVGIATPEGSNDELVVIKFDKTTGAILWQRQINGTISAQNARGFGMGIGGPSSQIVVCGSIYLPQNSEASNNEDRLLVAKYTADGTLLWSRTIRASIISNYDYTSGADADIDDLGNVYITGNYSNYAGGSGMIMTKLDTDGNPLWTNSFNGDCIQFASCIVAKNGKVYLGGVLLKNSNQNSADTDLLVGCLNAATGAVEWQRSLGKPGYIDTTGSFFGGEVPGSLIDVNATHISVAGFSALGVSSGNGPPWTEGTEKGFVAQILNTGATTTLGLWSFVQSNLPVGSVVPVVDSPVFDTTDPTFGVDTLEPPYNTSNLLSVLLAGAGEIVTIDVTPPVVDDGALWFNSVDGRLYLKYSGQWIDASPTEVNSNQVLLSAGGSVVLEGSGDETNILLGYPSILDIVADDESPNALTIRNALKPTHGLAFYIADDGNSFVARGDGIDGQVDWLAVSSTGETTISDGNNNDWVFKTTGNLQLPPGGDIVDASGNSVLGGAPNEITNTGGGNTYSVSVSTTGIVTMTTARGGIEFGAQPELIGGPSHLHIMRPAGQSSDLFFGDDYNYVKLPALSGLEFKASEDGVGTATWTLDALGKLTLPQGGTIADQAAVPAGVYLTMSASDLQTATSSEASVGADFITTTGFQYTAFNNSGWIATLSTLGQAIGPYRSIPVTWGAGSTRSTGFILLQDFGGGSFSFTPAAEGGGASDPGTWYFPATFGDSTPAVAGGTVLTVNSNNWKFGSDGILTLSTASTILGNGEDPNVYIETISFFSEPPSTWTFGTDGSLTFPDDTVQTTAYAITGTIPTSSTSTGITGQVATTGTDIYICVATNSWLKVTGSTF